VTTAPASDERQISCGVAELATARCSKKAVVGRAFWLANIALLVGLALWIACDVKFSSAAGAIRAQATALVDGAAPSANVSARLGTRAAILWTVCVASALSTLGIFATLILGASPHRRLRSWLAFTMLIALWLMVYVSWSELAWQGQRLRLAASLGEFDAVAAALRDNWPTADGQRTGLGNFTAYPQGKPTMLLLLTSDTSPAISAVERADDATLRFELHDDPGGGWLEWHPAGSAPQSFVGGLGHDYKFDRGAPLVRGWYLVRYH
jgi:hypothetical protein